MGGRQPEPFPDYVSDYAVKFECCIIGRFPVWYIRLPKRTLLDLPDDLDLIIAVAIQIDMRFLEGEREKRRVRSVDVLYYGPERR